MPYAQRTGDGNAANASLLRSVSPIMERVPSSLMQNSLRSVFSVIPAQAGIQKYLIFL
jgi:hypothetical protein